MSWLKLDDVFPTHSKVIVLSHRAFRLHVTALCYCAQNLTDGHIARSALPIIGAIAGKGKALTDELERVRLWLPSEGGWEVNGYLDLNPSKKHIQVRREVAKSNADKRWNPQASSNANGIAVGNATPNALPSHPIPSPENPLRSQPLLQVVARGTDNSPLGKLRRACGVEEGSEDEKKLQRAMIGVPEATIVDVALTAPRNVRDRLGWTLSQLKQRRPARASA